MFFYFNIGGKYQVYERQLKESPPVIQTTLLIRNVQPQDIDSYTCNASIDNDNERSKSLVVQLNGKMENLFSLDCIILLVLCFRNGSTCPRHHQKNGHSYL